MKEQKKGYEWIKKFYIYIVFCILFAVGILVSKDYGTYFDQESEINILYSNVKSYSEAIPSIGNLTADFFTNKQSIFPIGGTAEQDHGVAVYLPLFFIIQNHSTDGNFVNMAQHTYTFVLFFIGVISVFYIGKQVIKSKSLALLFAAIYYFTPRFFAEGHYNNKDIMLLSLMLITYAIGIACLKKFTILRCIMFAMVGALATNIKIVGILAPGIIGFIYCIRLFKDIGVPEKRKIIIRACGIVLLVASFYWIFTPAMWAGKRAYFDYILNNAIKFSRWDGYILYRGEIYRHSVTGLPSQYAIVQYLITTPIYISVLALLGMLSMIWDSVYVKKRKNFWQQEENVLLFLGTISSVLFMLYAMFSGMVIYNSWRHLYFCFLGVLFSILYLIKKIKEKQTMPIYRKSLYIGVVCLCLGWEMIGIVKNHPYQYGYMNALAGKNVEENYEIDYWCVSIANALSELCDNVPDEKIKILGLEWCTDGRLSAAINILPDEEKNRFIRYPMNSNLSSGMYVIENPTYSDMHAKNKYEKVRDTADIMVEIEAYGNTMMRIFRVK